MKKSVFMFGYWGWGNNTRALVNAIDSVEVSRGFKKPIFVDVRIRRNVRAAGFNGKAFEDIVGKSRYIWMPSLGNQSVADQVSGIKIKDPASASLLLDKVIEFGKSKQRIIFYCACEFPCECHRLEVGRLLLKYARKRKINLEVVEWPGGNPSEVELEVSKTDFTKIIKGQKSIPIDNTKKLASYAGLAWGSIAKVESNGNSHKVIIGPVKFQSKKWVLPVVDEDVYGPQNFQEIKISEVKNEISDWREGNYYSPL
jgi:hypothetical protein